MPRTATKNLTNGIIEISNIIKKIAAAMYFLKTIVITRIININKTTKKYTAIIKLIPNNPFQFSSNSTYKKAI